MPAALLRRSGSRRVRYGSLWRIHGADESSGEQPKIEERNLRRADEFLNVILPPSAAEELKATGRVAPRDYDGVAIAFTDIVGLAAIRCTRRLSEAARRPPLDWRLRSGIHFWVCGRRSGGP
jgi:hypothetical protein